MRAAGLAEKSTHTHKQSHGTNDGGGNGRMCRRGSLTRELCGPGAIPATFTCTHSTTNKPPHTHIHTQPHGCTMDPGRLLPLPLPLATCLEMANEWGVGGMTGLKGGIGDGRGCAAQIAFTEAERIFV
jgi:hypothetical protein